MKKSIDETEEALKEIIDKAVSEGASHHQTLGCVDEEFAHMVTKRILDRLKEIEREADTVSFVDYVKSTDMLAVLLAVSEQLLFYLSNSSYKKIALLYLELDDIIKLAMMSITEGRVDTSYLDDNDDLEDSICYKILN